MSSSRRVWALLLMLSGNMLLDALEVSTVVVAMPSIGHDLGLTPGAASWFMTGFALGFGGSILLGARLAAWLGRRRMYLAALLVFAIASVASGLVPDGPTLVAMRVVKGVCVALTAPTGLAIIASTFADGPPRRRALSIYTLAGASGFSAGLLLSGALTLISWQWTLLFSGPIALALFVFGLRVIPADTAPVVPAPGAWTGRLVRSALGAAALNGPYWGFLLVATFELQSSLGWSPLVTGIALLPTSLPLALTAPFAAGVVGRLGPPRLIAAGSVAALAGYAWYFTRADHHSYVDDVLPAVSLVGMGFVLSFSALHIQAITGVAPSRQGVTGGVYQTSVQLGGAVVLVLVALMTGSVQLIVTAVAAAGAVLAIAGLFVSNDREEKPCPSIRSESWSSSAVPATAGSRRRSRAGSPHSSGNART